MKSLDLETRTRASALRQILSRNLWMQAQKLGSSPKDTAQQTLTVQFHEHLRTDSASLHAGMSSSCGHLSSTKTLLDNRLPS